MCIAVVLFFRGCRCRWPYYHRHVIRCRRRRRCGRRRIRFVRFYSPEVCPPCHLLACSLALFFAVQHVLNPEAPVTFGNPNLPQPGDPSHRCVRLRVYWEFCGCIRQPRYAHVAPLPLFPGPITPVSVRGFFELSSSGKCSGLVQGASQSWLHPVFGLCSCNSFWLCGTGCGWGDVEDGVEHYISWLNLNR